MKIFIDSRTLQNNRLGGEPKPPIVIEADDGTRKHVWRADIFDSLRGARDGHAVCSVEYRRSHGFESEAWIQISTESVVETNDFGYSPPT